jgi:hypothetical protein
VKSKIKARFLRLYAIGARHPTLKDKLLKILRKTERKEFI